jgi:hypothetical protein
MFITVRIPAEAGIQIETWNIKRRPDVEVGKNPSRS